MLIIMYIYDVGDDVGELPGAYSMAGAVSASWMGVVRATESGLLCFRSARNCRQAAPISAAGHRRPPILRDQQWSDGNINQPINCCDDCVTYLLAVDGWAIFFTITP